MTLTMSPMSDDITFAVEIRDLPPAAPAPILTEGDLDEQATSD